VAVPETFAITSEQAMNNNALVALNGTFFFGDYSSTDSRHFVKIDNEVKYHTQDHEFNTRASGVVTITENFVDISGWTRKKETKNAGEAEDAMVSGPLILDNNAQVDMWDNAFIHNRHPRSFVASKSGMIVFGVVDGRDVPRAYGMSLTELRFFAEISGYSDLLNLDGGGSSTLYVKDQGIDGIVNTPSDGKERPVKSIIYLSLTQK
jgi:exopolysaccharide biosynthesis protein